MVFNLSAAKIILIKLSYIGTNWPGICAIIIKNKNTLHSIKRLVVKYILFVCHSQLVSVDNKKCDSYDNVPAEDSYPHLMEMGQIFVS